MSCTGCYVVTDFGAVNDGKTLNTKAVQAAIDAAGKTGGEVIVPPGTFLIGTIFMRSGVILTLQAGAILLGSPRIEDYIAVKWGHHMDRTPWHLIVAQGCKDITIRGPGCIDGNGVNFWYQDRPSEFVFYKHGWHRPSPMVEIERCEDVRIQDVFLTGSGGWTLHLWDCTRSWVRGVKIQNTLYGPNTDGIDVTGCHELIISDCHISTGDDAIALKSTVDSRDCRDITITNCILETSCVAVRIGYESRHDFRNITITNLVVKNCTRILDLRSIDGAVIENIFMSNVVAQTNRGWPFNRPIEMYVDHLEGKFDVVPEHPNHGWPFPKPPVGAIRNVTLRDMDILTDGRILLGAARPEFEVSHIRMENIRLRYAMLDDPSIFGPKAMSVGFRPGSPEMRGKCAALCVENIRDFVLRDFAVTWPTYPVADSWRMLTDPNRFCNKPYYEGNEEKIRTGAMRPSFNAIWARNVQGGELDLRGLTGSEPNVVACDMANINARVVRDV
jgi:hypothetical protein